MNWKIVVRLLLALLVMTLGAGVASATIPIPFVTKMDIECDEVEFEYMNVTDLGMVSFRVARGDGTAVSDPVEGDGSEGTHKLTVNIDPDQPEGTILKIQFQLGASSWFDIFKESGGFATGPCEEDEEDDDDGPEPGPQLPEPPYRLGGMNARLKIYVVEEDNGANNPVLAFYRVGEDGQGQLIFFIQKSALDAIEPDPNGPVEIFRSADGLYGFWKLPSGEYQVNAGPDFEGKVDVINFTEVPPPPTNVRRSQFSVYDILTLGAFIRYL